MEATSHPQPASAPCQLPPEPAPSLPPPPNCSLTYPDNGPPYRSFKQLRLDDIRVTFLHHLLERLYWPFEGVFPAGISAMKTRRGAADTLEPFFQETPNGGGTWHEIADLPVTEPKVSSLEEKIYELERWEFDWAWAHREENHEGFDAEYVTYGDLEDDIRPYPEWDDENGGWEDDSDTEFLVRCCGTDRPVRKRGQKIMITPAEGKDFVTVRDYVAAVHPWLMNMRDDLLLSKTVARPVAYPVHSLIKFMVVRGIEHLHLEEMKGWVSSHSPPRPLPPAAREYLDRMRAERLAAKAEVNATNSSVL